MTTDSAPAAKRIRRDYNDTIKVLVDPQNKRQQEFIIHKSIICSKSGFFKAACSKNWMREGEGEGKERTITLPAHDPEVFEVFVHWIYSSDLDLSPMTEPEGVDPAHATSYISFGKVWALAHYLDCKGLQNAVIDGIITRFARTNNIVAPLSLREIWEITPLDSTIRRLLTEATVRRKRAPCFGMEDLGQYPQEVVHEAAVRFFRGDAEQRPLPTLHERCAFHDHDEGEPRCK